MNYLEWFPERLMELRTRKGVSARDMSLSLGQSESYINKIENRRTMPSMAAFFYICEYLEIEPQEFLNTETSVPYRATELARAAEKLTPRQADHLLQFIKDIT